MWRKTVKIHSNISEELIIKAICLSNVNSIDAIITEALERFVGQKQQAAICSLRGTIHWGWDEG